MDQKQQSRKKPDEKSSGFFICVQGNAHE